MSEKDIVEGQVGPEGKYDVKLIDGKVRIDFGYQGAEATAGLYVEIGVIQLLDEVAAKYPSAIVQGAISLLKAAISAFGG